MSAKDYYGCTWREFVLRFEGYQLKRSHDFEHTRLLAYKLTWAHMDHEKSTLPPIHQWWPLITDEQEVQEQMSNVDAEYEHLRKIMELAEQNKLYN